LLKFSCYFGENSKKILKKKEEKRKEKKRRLTNKNYLKRSQIRKKNRRNLFQLQNFSFIFVKRVPEYLVDLTKSTVSFSTFSREQD